MERNAGRRMGRNRFAPRLGVMDGERVRSGFLHDVKCGAQDCEFAVSATARRKRHTFKARCRAIPLQCPLKVPVAD